MRGDMVTKPKDQPTDVEGRAQQAQREEPSEARELDAEIVRDLEVDEQADGIRGGQCWITCALTGIRP